jgi:hypothetical protein
MASKHKKHRLVVYAAPANNSSPPAAPVKPAAAANPAEGVLDFVIKLAAVGVFVVGVVTLASPWLRDADRQQHPLPPPGWVCWHVARVTVEDTQRDRTCEPAEGWHLERWPDGATVAVPDNGQVVRRHVVRD